MVTEPCDALSWCGTGSISVINEGGRDMCASPRVGHVMDAKDAL